MIRVVLGLLAGLYLWAGWLQINDADPSVWIGVYLAAAIICGLAAAGRRLPDVVTGTFLVGVLAAAGYLGWQVFVTGDVRPMFEQTAGSQPGLLATEEGRELLGLLIVGVGVGLTFVLPKGPDKRLDRSS